MLPLAISAKNIKTINVKQGDDINALLGSDKYSIDSLVVTGYVELRDFPAINDCCVYGNLSGIDMSGSTVEDDSIPDYAFDSWLDTKLYSVELQYFKFPKNITKIGNTAFAYTRIHKLDIPETVNYISAWAFHENWAVTGEVKIPEGVTVLGNCTFRNCYHIKKLILPSTLKKIAIQTFWGVDDLTEVTLPDGIEELGIGAFGCTGLKEITIPESVKKVGLQAFGFCQKLTKAKLPDNMTFMDDYLFYITGLKDLNWPSQLEVIGMSAFEDCKMESVILPNGVKVIKKAAFTENQKLRLVVLPEGLDSLGLSAFENCPNLDKIYIKNPNPPFTTTTLGGFESNSPFSSISENAVLYVPVGAKERYQKALYWKDFKDIREVSEFPTTAVEAMNMNDAASVSGGNGQITINASANATRYAVYSTDGRKVTEGVAKNETTVNVPSGLYIIKVGQKTSKVMVK
jgi:hypothetical protein